MITVLFFAQVREQVGCERMALASEFTTVEALRQSLAARGGNWALALEQDRLLSAVNQVLVEGGHPLSAGDEVAFFPPVTGG
ncbi:molybdopterin synthase sulfur carrier subunit [Acerihabitans sp. TG2]|uniref:molybdopterin synthase sulfur carrier subunit n=1 Tax=Acerihabitans sp. TG2 TaxID=3096008 RepID=UPI002B226AEC|nr:molybdopterin synthase sulfur carrier subunit [Acerihabitans sp. TG2]MEA9390555.1 molybdopterin synthase sulfur carrier subunit [Acerihabitans sp. TG2]